MKVTLQPLLSIPELLQFIEVLVQDVHLRRPHPSHPNYWGTSLAAFSPPHLSAPTWALLPNQGLPRALKSGFSSRLLLSPHILETVMPAGRPSTGCSPMGAPAHRAKTQLWCTAPCTRDTGWCAPLWCTLPHHLAPRDPTAGRGWRQPLNRTNLPSKGKAGPTQKPVLRTQLIGRRAGRGGLWGGLSTASNLKLSQS